MDDELLTKYPGLDNVASFLGESAKTFYMTKGTYGPFDTLGIRTEEEFIQLVEWGNDDATELYRKIKEILKL
jgi:hypothetical protein